MPADPINPAKCNRQDLVDILNRVGSRHGWGNVITTTTLQNLVSAGLPRSKEGRTHYYSILDLAAFYAYQRKTLDDRTPAEAKELDLEKKRQEVRRLTLANDENSGRLIDSEQVVSEWAVAGQVLNQRMQALVDRLESAGHVDAARDVTNTLGEMAAAVQKSLEKCGQ